MEQFTFQVPNVGTVKVNAANLQEALMDVADKAGIQMTACVRTNTRPKQGGLYLACVNGSVVTDRASNKG